MKLVYWMYNGPAHLGSLRTASSFKNVHAVMHAPLGDDYFNVMRSMLERERDFTPVTTSIVDRHVLARGSQEKVMQNLVRADKEEQPDLIVLTPTCTSSILQEDLHHFAEQARLCTQADVLLADVNHYRVNEFQAADRTFEQILRFYLPGLGSAELSASSKSKKTEKPSVNILGVYTLGFHHQHDCRELKRLLYECGIDVNLVLPEGGNIRELYRVPEAWFNIVPYREIGLMAAQYLEQGYNMPYVNIPPLGVLETASFIRQIASILEQMGHEPVGSVTQRLEAYIQRQSQFVSQSAWFSRSIDCQNLTGKRAVVFGDATHAASMTKILAREMGMQVCCAGTYCKQDADWFREQVLPYTDSILITDDHTQVSAMIEELQPNCLFGTQMERHIGKRFGIPCGVISSPSHIQNFPLGYRPFLGYEGTNQIADLVYNTNQLGMEEHLLEIFGGHDSSRAEGSASVALAESAQLTQLQIQTEGADPAKVGSIALTQINAINHDLEWTPEASRELSKIPGFVRAKVKKNVCQYARKNNILLITPELMYAAKENLS
jgi:light-independent protochlorophyllide reductase subunit B